MDTLQLICLDLLYIKKLMDSPKPKFDNSFVDWIHMNAGYPFRMLEGQILMDLSK